MTRDLRRWLLCVLVCRAHQAQQPGNQSGWSQPACVARGPEQTVRLRKQRQAYCFSCGALLLGVGGLPDTLLGPTVRTYLSCVAAEGCVGNRHTRRALHDSKTAAA